MHWLATVALTVAAFIGILAVYRRHEQRCHARMTPEERERDLLDQQTW